MLGLIYYVTSVVYLNPMGTLDHSPLAKNQFWSYKKGKQWFPHGPRVSISGQRKFAPLVMKS